MGAMADEKPMSTEEGSAAEAVDGDDDEEEHLLSSEEGTGRLLDLEGFSISGSRMRGEERRPVEPEEGRVESGSLVGRGKGLFDLIWSLST